MRPTVLIVVAILWVGSALAHDHHETVEPTPPTEHSIYNLDVIWKTQEGKGIQLKNLAGTVQVLAMAYTRCQSACPRIVADMKRIEKLYADKVGFVLVSLDPKQDTPKTLKAFADKNQLKGWVLLHGQENSVLDLAQLLGVKYKRINETDYVHSNLISVLNTKGEIVYQQIGLGVDVDKTIHVVGELIK